jgi:predicted amino acid-binding ACT domain protein
MPDLGVVARVSRTLLSLGDLDINDHSSYVLAGPLPVQGAVQWDRQQVSVPWVDGDITIARRRTNSTENISIYAAGADQASLDANIATLTEAFFQDRFVLQIIVGGSNHAWDCEAADLTQVLYDTSHVVAKYVTVTFAVPRMPIPLAGGF